jgi:hypothetical protein
MSTKVLAKYRKSRNALPGKRSARMRNYAKYGLILFIVLCTVGITLLLAEISTPGMAWYVYE